MAGYRKLGRTSSQRKALLRIQATNLLYHGKIVTTEARAKEVRKIVESLIALAVKEKDNFETVKVTAKVARKDADGKRVKEVVDGKKVTVYDEVEKEIKKDMPSRLHARRQMVKALYDVTEVPTAAAADVYAELKGIHFEGGSLQASLDMLQKTGTGTVINGSTAVDDVRGYQYYSGKLDQLASTFAKSMNDINNGKNPTDKNLLSNSTDDSTTGITAGNIGISKGWTSGTIHISTDGTNRTDTILDMIAAMKDTKKLNGKTFADYMNNLSTQLASDSSSNQTALKTGTTVLNSIQDSRESLSGVSLDEEATNMMTYVSAYNAASRLMTALDEVLNTLINNTGA